MHPCARCASLQRTCCQRAEVLVTGGDIARIEAATSQQDFWEARAPSGPAYLEDDPEDPRWLTLTVAADGRRRLLRREASGECHFLGPAGCRLALDQRPLVCRLYPYSYTEQGLTGHDDDYCPSDVLAAPGQSMSDVLGVDRDDATAWHAALYAELEQDVAGRGVATTAAANTVCTTTRGPARVGTDEISAAASAQGGLSC